MDTSSNDSFVWTNTSSDSIDFSSSDSIGWTNVSSDCSNIDSESVTETMVSSKVQDGAESESGSSYKKKLQKQLFENEEHMNKIYKKKLKKKLFQNKEQMNENTSLSIKNDDTNNLGNDKSSTDLEENVQDTSLSIYNNNNTNNLCNDESLSNLEENRQRIARISDRIRFEDDENCELETSYGKETKLLQVDKFRKAKNLRPAVYKLQKQALISKNDEIWILKCPQDMDTKALEGVDLTINEKCKIKVDGLTYEGSVDAGGFTTALLTSEHGNSVIKPFPVNGVVNLRRKVPKPHYVKDTVMVNNQTDFIPLPETKRRHPLLGCDYERAIKLYESVSDRIDHNETKCLKNKKKKVKLCKEETDGTANTKVEPCVKLEPELAEVEVFKKKNKKKRKRSSSEEISPKKLKRIKKEKLKQDQSSNEVWESEQAIEENLFNY